MVFSNVYILHGIVWILLNVWLALKHKKIKIGIVLTKIILYLLIFVVFSSLLINRSRINLSQIFPYLEYSYYWDYCFSNIVYSQIAIFWYFTILKLPKYEKIWNNNGHLLQTSPKSCIFKKMYCLAMDPKKI